MKSKKSLIVIIIAIVVAIAGGYAVSTSDIDITDFHIIGAEYYGCPNSKRVNRLNLRKNRK